jgi:hypothetical protein
MPQNGGKMDSQFEMGAIFSKSGFNEPGAIFRTEKPLGRNLSGISIHMIKKVKKLSLLNMPKINDFSFLIQINQISQDKCRLNFTHRFVALNEEGCELIKVYLIKIR